MMAKEDGVLPIAYVSSFQLSLVSIKKDVSRLSYVPVILAQSQHLAITSQAP